MSHIELRGVTKTFDDGLTVLDDISFTVEQYAFVTVLGPSGSGKSTILNLIAGLTSPTTGEVIINGPEHVAYMPQRDLLLPWRTVLYNAILPLQIKGVSTQEARDRARQLMDTFGLVGFEDAYPATLSGGMRQRAALLRTILTESPIMLLDEPFGALDAMTRRSLQDWLLALWQSMDKTILFVTHDVEEALYLGDRVIVLSERPGRIVTQVDVPFTRPRKRSIMKDPTFGEYMVDLLQDLGVTV